MHSSKSAISLYLKNLCPSNQGSLAITVQAGNFRNPEPRGQLKGFPSPAHFDPLCHPLRGRNLRPRVSPKTAYLQKAGIALSPVAHNSSVLVVLRFGDGVEAVDHAEFDDTSYWIAASTSSRGTVAKPVA